MAIDQWVVGQRLEALGRLELGEVNRQEVQVDVIPERAYVNEAQRH
jgi:hypothetical protein